MHSRASTLHARRIATRLIKVVAELGWRFNVKAPEPEPTCYRRSYETPEEAARRGAHFLIEEERLFISITERRTRTERPLTPEEKRERRRSPTGYFRVLTVRPVREARISIIARHQSARVHSAAR